MRAQTIACGVLLATLSCHSSSPPPDFVKAEYIGAMRWLELNGARLVGSLERSETEWSKEARWHVEVDQRWGRFIAGLESATPSGYDGCSFGRRSGTCTKALNADVVSLDIRLETSGRPTKMLVTLQTRAF